MNSGVIYVAEGDQYFDLAVQSARSLKAVAPEISITLFTDQSIETDLFEQVLPTPDICSRAKIASMIKSPYAHTLFLDCDTLVLRSPVELFEILERFDLGICHDVRRSSALIQEHLSGTIHPVFCQHNSGVMVFRKSAEMVAFLENWARLFDQSERGRDQISLIQLLWDSDLRFWVLPPEWNLRRLTLIDAWEPLDCVPGIIHSHQLLRHLRGSAEQVKTVNEILDLERRALLEEWNRAIEAIPQLARVSREQAFEIIRKERAKLDG